MLGNLSLTQISTRDLSMIELFVKSDASHGKEATLSSVRKVTNETEIEKESKISYLLGFLPSFLFHMS